MKTTKQEVVLTQEHIVALATWIKENEDTNWGGWSAYPELPVSASYLSYDTNPMQINLDRAVWIGGKEVNCITKGRRVVGAKHNMPMSASELMDIAFPEEANARLYEKYFAAYDRATKDIAAYDAMVAAYNNCTEETKATILVLESELKAIKGTPGSKNRRAELEAELSKLPVHPEGHAYAYGEGGWMREAVKFASAKEYANFKTKK